MFVTADDYFTVARHSAFDKFIVIRIIAYCDRNTSRLNKKSMNGYKIYYLGYINRRKFRGKLFGNPLVLLKYWLRENQLYFFVCLCFENL